MPRVLKHLRLNPPGYDPTPDRPVRLIARDLAHDAALPPHSHRWHQFLYASSGVIRVSTADTTWVVPPSRAIWIPSGITHHVAILESAHLRSLYVLPAAATLPDLACRVIEVSPLLRELIAELALDRSEGEPAREGLLNALILDELRIAEPLGIGVSLPVDKRLRALCLALIDDPSSARSLGQWAPQVGASARTLTRLFAAELGTSFAAWRQQVRLARAAPLIARGVPLSRVAAELGYNSQSAFSAMFKRRFGRSPSTFYRPLAKTAGRPP